MAVTHFPSGVGSSILSSGTLALSSIGRIQGFHPCEKSSILFRATQASRAGWIGTCLLNRVKRVQFSRGALPIRLMVGHLTLDQLIEIRLLDREHGIIVKPSLLGSDEPPKLVLKSPILLRGATPLG